jgi:hypothetical protein
MLLGCTEFIKAYLQVKENPWPFINLAKLVQDARMGDAEVVELLKIANGYLPMVRLEYDRSRHRSYTYCFGIFAMSELSHTGDEVILYFP